MTIWQRISDAISALAQGESLWTAFDKLRGPPERSVAFTIAVIALGAKMAKADGQVTRDEVTAFREVFDISNKDADSAARVYNLARQDVAGFDAYARKIAAMFDDEHVALVDLMEGLFHIALADGDYHDLENVFLAEVARIFRLTDAEFRAIRARFVQDSALDPYAVLASQPGDDIDTIRRRWKRMVKETHPDALAARGLPEEAIRMAEKRLVLINEAWRSIAQKSPV